MNTISRERGSTRQQHHLAFRSPDFALLNSDEHKFKHTLRQVNQSGNGERRGDSRVPQAVATMENDKNILEFNFCVSEMKDRFAEQKERSGLCTP